MVPGQDPFYFIRQHPLYRAIESLRIGRRIKGVKAAFVQEIPRIQIFPFRLIKAAVTGRMPRRVDDRNAPPAQFQRIAIMQKRLRLAVKQLIIVQRKLRRKAAGPFCQILFNDFQRQGKTPGEPVPFLLMHGNVVKISVAAGMIPVRVRCDHRERQLREAVHNVLNVGNAQSGID